MYLNLTPKEHAEFVKGWNSILSRGSKNKPEIEITKHAKDNLEFYRLSMRGISVGETDEYNDMWYCRAGIDGVEGFTDKLETLIRLLVKLEGIAPQEYESKLKPRLKEEIGTLGIDLSF